jgi:hypothetical protein
MNKKPFTCLLALAAVALSSVSAASHAQSRATEPVRTADNTLVVPPVTYGTTAEGVVLTDKDDGCDAPTSLRNAIEWRLSEPYLHVVSADPGNLPGIKTLKIEIVDILANKGGVMSGPKMVSIRGALYKDDQRLAGFKGTRSSMPFFPPRTTCNILGRATEALGGDLANWLDNPVDGAQLENL